MITEQIDPIAWSERVAQEFVRALYASFESALESQTALVLKPTKQPECLQCDRHVHKVIKLLPYPTESCGRLHICSDSAIVVCKLIVVLDDSAVKFHNVTVLEQTVHKYQ
jgi:hypothetical protein